MAVSPGHMAPVSLRREEGEYLVAVPDWGAWLDILDRSQRGTAKADTADVDRLLREWVRASVTFRPGGRGEAAPITGIGALPTDLVDGLVDAGTARLAEIEAALEMTREVAPDRIVIRTAARGYALRALSFAERNACLRGHLSVRGGVPEVDASAYELALVASSISDAVTGAALTTAELRALPLPLGEALIQAAQALSDPAAADELQSFAEAGVPHPDLDLAALCLAFGITPAEAEALPAATAKRLQAAVRLLQGTGSLAAGNPTPADPMPGDNVTRIVVHDG